MQFSGQSNVSHMYGNKQFHLQEARVEPEGDEIGVRLCSRKHSDRAPVRLDLTAEDAVKLGEQLIAAARCHRQ